VITNVPVNENENENENETHLLSNAIKQNAAKGVMAKYFDQFWQAYPKKRNKGQAEKAFEKVAPDEQLMAVILAAIERAKTSAQWLKENGQFIPYPATWLNAKSWEDDYACAEAGKRKSKWGDGW